MSEELFTQEELDALKDVDDTIEKLPDMALPEEIASQSETSSVQEEDETDDDEDRLDRSMIDAFDDSAVSDEDDDHGEGDDEEPSEQDLECIQDYLDDSIEEDIDYDED